MPVEVIGLKEANRALRQLPEIAKGDVQQVNDVTAFHVATEASRKAPRSADGSHGREPGFLASAISWDSRPRTVSAVVTILKAAAYWRPIEYGFHDRGGKFHAAIPFLRSTADRNRPNHRIRLLDALTRAGRKVAAMAK